MIYLNPEGDRHEPADEYLSGNVKRKLTVALAAGDAYRANVAALEKVIPEDLPPGDIALRLGAVWVPRTWSRPSSRRSSACRTPPCATWRWPAPGR
jgi:N12 class adenine-specific DNA methylase